MGLNRRPYSISGRGAARGSALFLILIAVALFAALSYAVTRSGRGGGDMNREGNYLAFSQMLDFAGVLQQAINRLVIVNGCTIAGDSGNTVNFGPTSVWPGQAGLVYDNPNSPGDGRCDVFSSSGAGVTMMQVPAAAQFAGVPNYSVVRTFSINGVGTGVDDTTVSGKDLVLMARVTTGICGIVTAKEELAEAPVIGSAINLPAGTTQGFRGTYSGGGGLGFSGASVPLAGHSMGCFVDTVGPIFYYVLLAR